MKFDLKDNSLKIYLTGKIDSNNSESIEKEIEEILNNNEHRELVIDVCDLEYTSSAGLRVLIKLAKKEKVMRIDNTSPEVYEIFEITGLTNVLNINKKLRKLSTEGLELIGSGYFSKVYRIDRDTIVKVFIRTDNFNTVQRELDLAKQGFILGLPTAISYDVVEVDGMPGLVFEMLNCKLLKDEILDNLDRFDEYMMEYAKLLKTINTTDVKDSNLPNAKDIIKNKIEAIKDYISDEERNRINELVETIPDSNTFIHGDCQIKNIMLNNGEFLVIDMETLSKGDAIFELGSLYAAYYAFGEIQKGYEGEFFGIPNEMPNQIFDSFIKYYFENISEDNLKENILKISLVCYTHMIWWIFCNEKDNTDDLEYMYGRFKDVLAKLNDLKLKY